MSEAGMILAFIALGVLGVTWVGIRGGARASGTLEGWVLNSRLMGPMLLWFLLGTEIYTSFTFLGLAGFAYARGGGVFYNVATNDIAYALGFFVLPALWLAGRRFGYLTQADYIAGRYGSPGLGMLVALGSALILVPYIDLNIEGMGAILNVLTHGAINLRLADTIAFLVLSVSVFVGGIRGNAWQSVIKDVLMFIAIAALFVVVPLRFFNGFGPMFHRLVAEVPQRITMPGPTGKLGLSWFISTVLLTGLGQWMWPQWFAVGFTARGPRALKLQAVFMPLYQVVKVAVILIGFAAVLIFAGHKVAGNTVVMRLAEQSFPGWFLAIFALAAVLSAIVPAGAIIVTCCTLLSHNVHARLRPATTPATTFGLARWLVFPVTLAALGLAVAAPALIVVVLLVAYDFIAQLLPAAIIGGLFWRRATMPGVVAGLLVGWVVSAALLLTKHGIVFGLNAGLVALLANVVVFVVVSLITRPPPEAVLQPFFAAIYASGRRAGRSG